MVEKLAPHDATPSPPPPPPLFFPLFFSNGSGKSRSGSAPNIEQTTNNSRLPFLSLLSFFSFFPLPLLRPPFRVVEPVRGSDKHKSEMNRSLSRSVIEFLFPPFFFFPSLSFSQEEARGHRDQQGQAPALTASLFFSFPFLPFPLDYLFDSTRRQADAARQTGTAPCLLFPFLFSPSPR